MRPALIRQWWGIGLIVGAGFGGLELAGSLDAALGTDVEVTLVDRAEGFVFGFSKLDVMFGRVSAEHVLHRYADLAASASSTPRCVRSTR